MHINNLLLSLAVPVASKVVDVAAEGAKSLGQSFAHFLADASTAVHEAPQANEESISEELLAYAEGIRNYLSKHNVTEGFRIRFEKSSSGEVSSGVAGPNAESVVSLLQQRPQWMRDLQAIAAAAQAANAVPGTGRPPHLNIEINEHGTSHWYLR